MPLQIATIVCSYQQVSHFYANFIDITIMLIWQITAQAGFDFSIPYLYNGMGFAGVPPYVECADNRTAVADDSTCADLRICVLDGTTYVDRIMELFPDDVAMTLSPTVEAFYNSLGNELCNVLAGKYSLLL